MGFVIFFLICFVGVINPRSIHVVVNGTISLFFMAEWYSLVFMYHIFSIHSSVDGHLDCFHVLTIINSLAMNIDVLVSL